ncbi:hypothetical protein RvY_09418 [Ramazzottius varieornatus]|uniref:Uncharacterized protein n=1 Tax=Ramazzottius varieornatus TaxID=947166 RepID=A0A1D1VH70_RAMVA|nr:hypothetical protein RvY_09418 [Ramazzottius varieornatus]
MTKANRRERTGKKTQPTAKNFVKHSFIPRCDHWTYKEHQVMLTICKEGSLRYKVSPTHHFSPIQSLRIPINDFSVTRTTVHRH